MSLNSVKLIPSTSVKQTYTRGDIFLLEEQDGEEPYMLCTVGQNKATLIGLRTGNLWSQSLEVGKGMKYSNADMVQLSGGSPFRLFIGTITIETEENL